MRLLITPNYVIDAVCRLTGKDKEVLKYKRIPPNYSPILGIIVYILVEKLNYSKTEVARIFHKKSYISIIQYLKKVEALRIDDMDFRREMDDIVETIVGE